MTKGDPDGMNKARAKWALCAVKAFQRAVNTDDEDAVGDLLCDLMHLCAESSRYQKFNDALRRARSHFKAETEGRE